jgi:hypothetical protein
MGETFAASKRSCLRWVAELDRAGRKGRVIQRKASLSKNDDSFLNKRPVGFELNGKEYPAFTWAEVLRTFCNALRAKHRNAFDQKALSKRGTKRVYFQSKPKGLRNAHKLDGEPPVYVETSFSSNAIVRLCRDLLTRIEPDAEFRVLVQ